MDRGLIDCFASQLKSPTRQSQIGDSVWRFGPCFLLDLPKRSRQNFLESVICSPTPFPTRRAPIRSAKGYVTWATLRAITFSSNTDSRKASLISSPDLRLSLFTTKFL